jgi:hypothetical protein
MTSKGCPRSRSDGRRLLVNFFGVAREKQMTQAHLEAVGIQIGSNHVIAGAEDEGHCSEFEPLWYEPKRTDPPGAYYDKAEKDFLQEVHR